MSRAPTTIVLARFGLVTFILGFASTLCHSAEPTFIGSSSCATSTCHGGVIDQGPAWNHSYSKWMASDPHRGAGLLLLDDDSRAIVERLNPDSATSSQAFDQVLRERCITCHATPSPSETANSETANSEIANSRPLDEAILHEGVSCEACHGAASKWQERHVLEAWKGPRRFEPATGMIDTETVAGRAKSCVRCHVGSRSANGLTRDMNHDLIAAGHPALRFDLLIYNENLPVHWDVSGDVEVKFNESPIRTRSIGRSVSLAAAAALSGERASGHLKDPTVPWPELADYDCFACHQSLSIAEFKLPSSDRSKSPLQVSLGLPVWNTWHTTNQVELRQQKARLEKLSPHLSEPNDVAEVAASITSAYVKQANNMATINQLKSGPPADWHQAAVQFLEIDAAIRQFELDPKTKAGAKRYRTALSEVEKLLRFDANREPGNVADLHSPNRFSPNDFRQTVLRVFPKL